MGVAALKEELATMKGKMMKCLEAHTKLQADTSKLKEDLQRQKKVVAEKTKLLMI